MASKNIKSIIGDVSKFTCIPTTKDVATIIIEAVSKININTTYQRDVVWDDEKQCLFINSIFLGIVPNALIFNSKPGVTNCIDGKQRLTSLIRFKNNEIYVKFNDIIYFYDTIPRIYKTDRIDPKVRILTKNERHDWFDTRSITVNQYKNLSYQDEIDIFNRIQNGMVLTSGEKLIASTDKEEIADIIKNKCDSKKELFSRYSKWCDRGNHHIIIVNTMYIIQKNKLCSLTAGERKKYVQSFQTVDDFESKFKNIDKLLNVTLGKYLLGHPSVRTQNINKNLLFTLIHFIHQTFPNLKISAIEKKLLRKMIHIVAEISKNKFGASCTSDTFSEIYSTFVNIYDQLKNGNDEDDGNESSEEETNIPKTKKDDYVPSKSAQKKMKKHNEKIKKSKHKKD